MTVQLDVELLNSLDEIGRGQGLAMDEQIQQALNEWLSARDSRGPGAAYPRHLLVRVTYGLQFITVSRLQWCQADRNYVQFHFGPKSVRARHTLSAVQALLDPTQFLRINRSTVVNLDAIEEMRIGNAPGDYTVLLQDGTGLSLTRSWRSGLLKVFAKPL